MMAIRKMYQVNYSKGCWQVKLLNARTIIFKCNNRDEALATAIEIAKLNTPSGITIYTTMGSVEREQLFDDTFTLPKGF